MNFKVLSEKKEAPSTDIWAETNISNNLFTVVSAANKNNLQDFKNAHFGADVIAHFLEEFNANTGTPFDALKNATQAAKEKNLDISAFTIIDDHIFASLNGTAKLLLTRGGKQIELISTQGEHKSGSGKVKVGDIYSLINESGAKVKAVLEDNSKKIEIDKQATFGLLHASNALFSKVSRLPVSILKRRPRVRQATTTLDDKKKSKAPLIGAMLLTILIVSIFFGLKQKSKQDRIDKYLPALEKAQHELDEARALAPLNASRARELVLGAKSTTDSLISQEYDDPKVLELSEEINNAIGPIAGIYVLKSENFLDLNILRQGLEANEMVLAGDLIKILDTKNSRLVSLDIKTKHTQIIAGKDDLFNPFALAAYDNRNFVMSIDGLREVGDETELQIKPEEWDPQNVLVSAFANNIYILDKNTSEITRYPGIRLGFADGSRWLAPGIVLNLQNSISWSIDGSIWILEKGGEISKLTQGVPERFSLEGVSNLPVEATKIFTSQEAGNVYILDTKNSRILVVNKQGGYVAEYISDLLSQAQNFTASEEANRVVFNIGSNLYSIELKHLIK